MAMGQTIGDLQQKISWSEYIVWMQYRAKYGPLNPVRKHDMGFAILAQQVNNLFGGKASWKDFIFWGKPDKDEKAEVTLDTFIKAFGGKIKIGKRR